MTGRRGIIASLVGAAVLATAPGAFAQTGPAPIQATIFLQNPPPGSIPSYGTGVPIAIVVQVQNASGGPLLTTEGFSRTDFFRLLHFFLNSTGTGPSIVNTSGAAVHRDLQTGQCFSLNVNGVSVLQSPAIPVVPVEALAGPPTPFFVEYVIPDARLLYPLTPGRYLATAIIPFSAFSSKDSGTLLTNCETFPTPVLNVGGVGTSQQDFTIVSNSLDFRVCCFGFVGFGQPLGPESTCAASPCLTTNFGNGVPVKLQLFDASGAAVRDALARIAVNQISGTPPPQPPTDLGKGSQPLNTFKFDPTNNQYVFNLDTSVLSPGVWRIVVSVSDGSVHTVEIQLR